MRSQIQISTNPHAKLVSHNEPPDDLLADMLNLFRFARSVPCLALFSLRRNPPRAGTRARSALSRRRPPFFPRLAGDFSHVISILVLLLRLRVSRSALGISLKTQELYLIVFVARYADLFSHFYSYYNTGSRRDRRRAPGRRRTAGSLR